jgi:hypothetical protein
MKRLMDAAEVFKRIREQVKKNPGRKNATIEATRFVKGQLSRDILKLLPKIVEDAKAIMNLYPQDVKTGTYEFSKIIPMNNRYGLRCPLVKITLRNKKYLECEYVRRRKGELEYLKRWFPKKAPVKGVVGSKVDVIVYDAAQLAKEGTPIKSDFGIVAINVEMKKSSPVPPMTMINNQLGVEFGGNGSKIDWKGYKKSVAFWKQYAIKQR